MAKDILKEAIADAKAVREVALANAKAALEEAFTPKLQSMLSAKLSEELDEDIYDEDDDVDVNLDIENDDLNLDMEDLMDNETEDEENIELGEMGDMYDEDKEDEGLMDEEIDLEEILNELESEEEDSEEEEETIDEMGKPNYKAEYVQTQHTYKADDIMENEEFDLDALLKEINDLDKNPRKKANPRVSTKRSIRKGRQFPTKPLNEKRTIKGGCRETSLSLKETQKELGKLKNAYSTVKKELNEVNLLNSKLLYVNRIFKSNSLDDPQKLRVVETLDKAGSVKEAKLIYETIKDSFSISNEALEKEIKKEIRKNTVKRTPKKSIRENLGMASKAAGMSRTKKVAPKRAVINESDNMVSRFQKLANIKINE